jgi:hypothetical protein
MVVSMGSPQVAIATKSSPVQTMTMSRNSSAPWSLCAVLLFGLLQLPAATTVRARGLQIESTAMAAGASSADAHAILVELFTSEGCSSCPPADALLQKMDASQPVAGGQVIVLSEHVDYWDHDGWKDPNSSPALTDRQSSYVRALGLSTAYTPQLIVDGTREMRAGDPHQMGQILREAAATPKVPVRISTVSVDAGSPAVLRMHIEADGNFAKHNADVYVVVALERVESQVLHGENGGRHLTHVAVVQQLTKIGRLPRGKTFGEDVQLKLKPGTDPKNVRLVAFVQEPGPGRLLGAVLRKPAS